MWNIRHVEKAPADEERETAVRAAMESSIEGNTMRETKEVNIGKLELTFETT